MSVLVLGLGNPLRGDDGIGPRVVAELRRQGLPPDVQAIDGGLSGLDLLRMLEGWERAIIVDAADVGLSAGEFVRFTPQEARLIGNVGPISIHTAGLAEVLTLADALGRPLPPILIFGVQPEQTQWGEGLSPAVEAALPALIEAVLQATSNQQQVGEDNGEDPDR